MSHSSPKHKKICTVCKNTWYRPNRLTVKEFYERDWCTRFTCRPARSRPKPVTTPNRDLESADNHWFINSLGMWRPPGFPDTPYIPFDHTVESILMGYGPNVATMERL